MIAPNMKHDLKDFYYKEAVPTASLIQYDLMMMGAANKADALFSEYTRSSIRIENSINNIVGRFTGSVVSDQDISNLRNSSIDYAKEKISRLAQVSEYVGNKGLGYYIHGDNGDVVFRPFSHSEIKEVAKSNFDDMQMHHESSLHLLRADTSNETLRRVVNPDNINPYSTNAHLSQHGGNWRNPTDDLNTPIKEAEEKIRDNVNSGDATEPDFNNIDDSVLLFMGILTVSFLFRAYMNRKKGYHNNKRLLRSDLTSSARDAALTSGTFFLTTLSRESIGSIDVFNGVDALSSVDELLGSAAAFTVASAVHKAYGSYRAGYSKRVIISETKDAIWKSAKKSALFMAGGVLLDCLTPLPDPTIALVVSAARLTWNIGSWVYKYNENKQAQIDIAQIKISFYYQKALGTVI